ncbi:hypothetical protein [Psychroserpens damuponensis]|uniref:hypothetical protein n=1 Tax=Psychroserpens damuponensis TaxID=943936 RepID=UPI00058BC54E|nr:hypothetical protein [Psychroserpens damuponensis]
MKRLFLVLFTISMLTAQAQKTSKLNVTESEQYKDDVKTFSIKSIHTTTSNLTGIVRESKRDILFDIFDNNLKKTFSKVVDREKKERFVGELFFGDEIKYFTVYSPKKKERIVYCHTFNIATKSYNKKEIFSATVEKNQGLFSGRNKRQTSFALSPDGQYFAMATDDIKKNLNSYTIRVYNAQTLEMQYKQSYREDAERYYQPNDLTVSNEGTVYSLGKLFKKGKRQKKGGEANYEFVLNEISKGSVKDVFIGLGEDEHIQSLTITDIDNELHLIGFYSEKNVGRIKGGCNFMIDTNNLSVKNKKLLALPQEVYDDLYGYRKAKRKNDKELSNFYIDYVLTDGQGTTYMLAEEFYVTSHYVSTGTTGGYWTYTYHYDDVLIIKFNAEGNLDWGRSIFKRSTAPSYNAFMKNGELHVILNSGKNLKEKKDGRTKASTGWFESSSLYDFVYSASGEVSYDKIQDNKGNTFYTPFYGTFENEKFIMMSNRRSKKKQFMTLE